jgi:hypothetical protein
VLLAAVLAVGMYRGWFTTQSATDGSQSNLTITVDKDKIQQDEQMARDKAGALGQAIKQNVVAPATRAVGDVTGAGR